MHFDQHEADGYSKSQKRIDEGTKLEILEFCKELGTEHFARDTREDTSNAFGVKFISG